MFRHLFILLITSLISSLSLFAVSTSVIKGNAKRFANQEVTFYSYQDYITNTKTNVGYAQINSTGAFRFSFPLNQITEIYIKIEDKISKIFIEPGKIYNIDIFYDEKVNKGRIYDRILSIQFTFPSARSLNQEIGRFNRSLDDFLIKNTDDLERNVLEVEKELDKFREKWYHESQKINIPFVRNYIKYSIGNVDNARDVSYKETTINMKAKVFLSYLNHQKILYNNSEYMTLFCNFFKGEFKRLSLTVKGEGISRAIKDHKSYTKLSETLKQYPFFKQKELRDLFILHGLLEAKKDPYFKQKELIGMLQQMLKYNTNPAQKQIAKNIIKKLTKKQFGKGTQAPLFTLKNREGKTIRLSDFKGKYVYINFWANWSTPSLIEMQIIEGLYKKYKTKVAFISVCTDNDVQKMNLVLENNINYQWNFLHIGNGGSQLLEDYKVVSTPTYVLLDRDLRIMEYPAPRPGGSVERSSEVNLEDYFYNLVKE